MIPIISKVENAIPILNILFILNYCSFSRENLCTFDNQNTTFIGKYSLFNLINLMLPYPFRPPFPHFIDKDVEKSKLNPIFDPFRKIDFINFNTVNAEDAIRYLKDAKELELSFKKISFYPDSTEEIEQITDPEYFKKGVNTIYFYFNKSIVFSDTFFTNINDIRPRSILLNFGQEIKEEFELIKILSKIKNCKSLQLFKYCFIDKWNLSFKNTSILVKSNKFDSIFIEWKNFTWEVIFSQFNQQFWFTKENSKDETFMHITKWSDLELNDFQAWSIEESKLYKNIFSTQLSKCNDELELIIPMSYLNSVNINKEVESSIDNIFWSEFIKKIWNAPKISWELNFSDFLKNINQICSLH